MKKALLLLPLFFLSSHAYSDTWNVAACHKGNPSTIAILSNDSIKETENGTLTATIAEIRDEREKRVDLVLQKIECNCKSAQVRYLEAKGYLRGEEMFTDTVITDWVTAKLESFEEVFLEGVCNNLYGDFNIQTNSTPELIKWGREVLQAVLKAENGKE